MLKMLYTLCTFGENEKIILLISTNSQDCSNLKNEIKNNCKKYGHKFYDTNYWIETIDITKQGILWECN